MQACKFWLIPPSYVCQVKMSEKDKLALEKTKLEEKKRRVSQVIGTITNEEDQSLLPSSSKTVFDYLFKIVIVGDAVSIKCSQRLKLL